MGSEVPFGYFLAVLDGTKSVSGTSGLAEILKGHHGDLVAGINERKTAFLELYGLEDVMARKFNDFYSTSTRQKVYDEYLVPIGVRKNEEGNGVLHESPLEAYVSNHIHDVIVIGMEGELENIEAAVNDFLKGLPLLEEKTYSRVIFNSEGQVKVRADQKAHSLEVPVMVP